jgi:hypothetical protein
MMQNSSSYTSSNQNAIDAEEKRLHQAAAEKSERQGTGYLSAAERHRLPLAHSLAYGLNLDTSHYLKLPRAKAEQYDSVPFKWLIEIQGLRTGNGPLGIEMLGDIVFGMDRGDGTVIDVDMTPYAGNDLGVSRKHAVIRPTRSRLYLIDLDSTNGTRLNALPVGPGIAAEIRSGDTVSLGNLNFTVNVVAKPQ